jgi:hypothetical protein
MVGGPEPRPASRRTAALAYKHRWSTNWGFFSFAGVTWNCRRGRPRGLPRPPKAPAAQPKTCAIARQPTFAQQARLWRVQRQSGAAILAARRAAPRPRIRSLGQAFDLACKELSLDPRPALVAVEQVRSRHRAIPIDRVNAHQQSVRYVSRFSGVKQY